MKRLTLDIHGMVQGVGYRYQAQQEARRRALVGFVRNATDGSVELVAEGDEAELKNFIAWCYNGVGTAVVQNILERWSKATGEFSDFDVK